MTNAQTGKIALLAPTMKPDELAAAIDEYLGPKKEAVKSVSLDKYYFFLFFNYGLYLPAYFNIIRVFSSIIS